MVPSGYERLLLGHAVAVARADVAPAIRSALVGSDGKRLTLHEYAARHPSARALQGRLAAYAVPLPPPGAHRVVVRHNTHGGMFAAITGDRFLSPTRAPRELKTALALRDAGVATPDVVAFALYPPGGVIQRSDVATLEVPDSRDLAQILSGDDESDRAEALRATAALLRSLAGAGARHADLNAKNVLVNGERAYVLDVDRVTLGASADDVMTANLARLARSLRKWRDRFGARISESEIASLESAARAGGTTS